MICTSTGDFTGCPMDGCENTLSGFVDIAVDGFDKDVKWRRIDLLTNSSRGCVSNGGYSLICAADIGYVSLNMTNGQVFWSIALANTGNMETASLPVINDEGFVIIANSTRIALINPEGIVKGTFNFNPVLIPSLAGPFVTNEGLIIVADLVSFVAITDSGIPLGVQALPPDYLRLSRSVSFNWYPNRWYLTVQHNTSFSKAIVAAEATGDILERLRIAWIYEYGTQSDLCNGMEGPLISLSRPWFFVANTTGILIMADNGDSASIEYLVDLPGLCASSMAYLETESTLLVIDNRTLNIIVLNIATRIMSQISLSDICQETIIGQLSRITIIQNSRMFILVVTAARQALLLLIDYSRPSLLARFDLGYVSETAKYEPLTQLAYTETDEKEMFVIIAHKAVGVIAVRLLTSNP